MFFAQGFGGESEEFRAQTLERSLHRFNDVEKELAQRAIALHRLPAQRNEDKEKLSNIRRVLDKRLPTVPDYYVGTAEYERSMADLQRVEFEGEQEAEYGDQVDEYVPPEEEAEDSMTRFIVPRFGARVQAALESADVGTLETLLEQAAAQMEDNSDLQEIYAVRWRRALRVFEADFPLSPSLARAAAKYLLACGGMAPATAWTALVLARVLQFHQRPEFPAMLETLSVALNALGPNNPLASSVELRKSLTALVQSATVEDFKHVSQLLTQVAASDFPDAFQWKRDILRALIDRLLAREDCIQLLCTVISSSYGKEFLILADYVFESKLLENLIKAKSGFLVNIVGVLCSPLQFGITDYPDSFGSKLMASGVSLALQDTISRELRSPGSQQLGFSIGALISLSLLLPKPRDIELSPKCKQDLTGLDQAALSMPTFAFWNPTHLATVLLYAIFPEEASPDARTFCSNLLERQDVMQPWVLRLLSKAS